MEVYVWCDKCEKFHPAQVSEVFDVKHNEVVYVLNEGDYRKLCAAEDFYDEYIKYKSAKRDYERLRPKFEGEGW